MASVGHSMGVRYGSAAELATYAGLSTKTIRRLVASGAVRGRKVGRRLLIPFEDIDTRVMKIDAPEAPAMSATHASVDASGLAVPLSPIAARERARVASRALASLDGMGEEAEQAATLAALLEGLGGRPGAGR